MLQYVVVPAVQAHSATWLNENTRSAVDLSRQWAAVVQQWARRLADFLARLAEMRFEQCTRKMLCTLGRSASRGARQEKRSAGSRLVELLNNVFRWATFCSSGMLNNRQPCFHPVLITLTSDL